MPLIVKVRAFVVKVFIDKRHYEVTKDITYRIKERELTGDILKVYGEAPFIFRDMLRRERKDFMKYKALLLGGKKAAGKDTLALFLKEYLENTKGIEVELIGMSDPLLEALLVLNPFVVDSSTGIPKRVADLYKELNEDYTALKEDPEVRRLLQTLGTDLVRDMIDDEAWVKIAERKVRENADKGIFTILTGVRFPNELAIAEKIGTGYTVYVDRDFPEDTLEEDSNKAHSSEHALLPEDFLEIVENKGDLESLKKQAIRLGEMLA